MSDPVQRLRELPTEERARLRRRGARADPDRARSQLRGRDRSTPSVWPARARSGSTCWTCCAKKRPRGWPTTPSWPSSAALPSATTWAPGFVFANKIRWRLYDQLLEFIDRGGLALGICNGFQTMVRLGMLPGLDGDYRTPRATLAPNDRAGYRDAWVRLAFDAESPCVWTRGLTHMELPARHGEGKFLAESPELLERLEAAGPGRGCATSAPDDRPTMDWPHNPNGSPHAVAGVCDPSGRLFGLMPHPDAYLYPFHHPRWRRFEREGNLPPEGEGLAIFRNGVDTAAVF